MNVQIDYTLDVRGQKLNPISKRSENGGILATYKYNERIIELYFFLNTGEPSYSGTVFSDEDHYKFQQLDGTNSICTNFCLNYKELVEEIEIALKLIENPKETSLPDVSVNKYWMN